MEYKIELSILKNGVILREEARVAELVDAVDLKSTGAMPRAGSSPAPGTIFNLKGF